MDNEGSADNGVLSKKADLVIGQVQVDDAASVGLNVSKVTYVPLGGAGVTVLAASGLHGRKESLARTTATSIRESAYIEMRAGGGASVAAITELVDVETSLSLCQPAEASAFQPICATGTSCIIEESQ